MNSAAGSRVSLTPALMTLLVIAVFTSAGSIHYQTPMLGEIAGEFAATPAAAGWVARLAWPYGCTPRLGAGEVGQAASRQYGITTSTTIKVHRSSTLGDQPL